LNDIVAKVRQVDELVTEVASASHEQAQGITQINSAVTQMDAVTQGNAAHAEESASAAHELNSQADALKEALTQMQTLLAGTKAAGEAAPQRTPPSRPLPALAKRSRSPLKTVAPHSRGMVVRV
jgi:ABC-type transporter Mla subunit MlaD